MSSDPVLFDAFGKRVPAGRVRRGLDGDVRAARRTDAYVPDGLVAALRTLADQIDALERWCRDPGAKPYDRVPLTGMVRQYADLHAQCFAAVAGNADPLTRALADFMAAESGTGATTGDPAGPLEPE